MSSCLDDGLVLGLGSSTTPTTTTTKPKNTTKPCFKFDQVLDHHDITCSTITTTTTHVEPLISLSLSGDRYQYHSSNNNIFTKKEEVVKQSVGGGGGDHHRQASPHSTVSSFSGGGGGGNGMNRVKRERDLSNCSEEMEVERGVSNSRISDHDDEDGANGRKKLRLTKEQSALLEESFKIHSTLNPKQKQALARQLNLRPRQVEVWFQNRRARTKLKQTEVDCEFLKKCCETLTEENRRLQKELQELKALKLTQPFYMQMPAGTLTMCPSCERIGDASTSNNNGTSTTTTTTTSSKTTSLISLAPKTHSLFNNPFTNSPAAC